MAKRMKLASFDFSAFDEIINELDALGDAHLNRAIEECLENIADEINARTEDAMSIGNLPAKGEYSTGRTKDAIAWNERAEWVSGYVCEIGAGFTHYTPNAGIMLITGTPRMQPNYKLEDIYARKGFYKIINKTIDETMRAYIEDNLT